MSTTQSHSSGLQSWANETRLQLTLASQEEEFSHYVQSSGFDWLATYVRRVLSDESIVELAKTPGRQKSLKQTRSQTKVKTASAVKLKAINDQLKREKERSRPLSPILSPTNLQRALLRAKHSDSDEDFENVAPLPVIKPSTCRSASRSPSPSDSKRSKSVRPPLSPIRASPLNVPVSTPRLQSPHPTPTKDRPLQDGYERDENLASEVPPVPSEPDLLDGLRPGVGEPEPPRLVEPELLALPEVPKPDLESSHVPRVDEIPMEASSPPLHRVASEVDVFATENANDQGDRLETPLHIPQGNDTNLLEASDQQLPDIPTSVTHMDIVIPTKEDSPPVDPTKFGRGSWVARAMGDSTRSRSAQMSANSGAVPVPSLEISGKTVSARSSQAGPSESTSGVKRGSDHLVDDDESGRASKVPRVGSESRPTGNVVGRSDVQHVSGQAPAKLTNVAASNDQPSIGPSRVSVTPASAEASSAPKQGLDKLREMLHGIQQPHRSNAPMRLSSTRHTSLNVPQANTRTFSLSELIDQSGLDGSDEHEVSDEGGSPSSDNEVEPIGRDDDGTIPPENADENDISSDAEPENVQTGEDAVMMRPVTSHTPPESPSGARFNDSVPSPSYSIPGGGPSSIPEPPGGLSSASLSSVKLVAASRRSSPQLPSVPFLPGASPPGTSILTAALGTLSSMISAPAQFFSSVVKEPASPPPASRPPPSLLGHNPFAPSPTPSVSVKVNPFLVSPSHPSQDFHPTPPPRPSETPPRPQAETQSTVLSSQASGASWFAPSRTTSRISLGSETDITESQVGEPQKPSTQLKSEAPSVTAPTAPLEQDPVRQLDAITIPKPPPRQVQPTPPLKPIVVIPTSNLRERTIAEKSARPNRVQNTQQLENSDMDKNPQTVQDDVPQTVASKPPGNKQKVPESAPHQTEAPEKRKRDKEKEKEGTTIAPVKATTGEDASKLGKKRKLDAEQKPSEKFKPVPKSVHSLKQSTSSHMQPGHSRTQSQPRFAPKPVQKPSQPVSVSNLKTLPPSEPVRPGILTKTALAMTSAGASTSTFPIVKPSLDSLKQQASLEALMAQERERVKDLHDQIESENIVLAEIQSEYEFSDDEGPPRRVNDPEWTQPDQLEKDLRAQQKWDPDEIFGPIGPLHMEQIFKTSKPSKFRQRSSSANWNTGDGLTQKEIVNYRMRMGYEKPEGAP